MNTTEFFNEFVVTNRIHGQALGLLTSLKRKLDIEDCDACKTRRTGDNIADTIDVLQVTLMILFEVVGPGAVSELAEAHAQRIGHIRSSAADSTSVTDKKVTK